MAYIGKKPIAGNFQMCDAISVVNGQAAYTMQVGGVNVAPETALNTIVSLNGTIQKANSSYTIANSVITFSSNLVTGDVIDFILILGDVLSIGTPSDGTVATAKLADDAVTAAKINNDIISGSTELATAPADTDEFLVSDAGTLKRIDYSLIKGGGAFEKISTTTISSNVASVDFDTLSTDYRDFRIICSDLRIDTHQQFVLLKVKRAGQSSYDGGSNEYIYAVMGYDSDSNEIKAQSTGDNKLKLIPASLARDATVDGANADILIDCYNVHATDSKFMIRADTTFIEGTYGRAAVGTGGGYRNALDAIIGIQIAAEGSTEFISGTVTLYGRKI